MSLIDLNELSQVGFGCYRVTDGVEEHRKALMQAIKGNCNLFDTAPNYSYGRSEEALGNALIKSKKRAFVVTKAGYIQGPDLSIVTNHEIDEVVKISEQSYYSLSPDFLNRQLT